ncbi:hypothetical protein EDD73_1149 [Heliophilum fasciatum]|uniref:Uncharacterized protein n=1 Tax=Heliophilum fasciatum TaxID=35700 RepID=A0A4R2RJ62_9FIRM|nr:hypothetical protein [Heliophilum fasciatum]TCP63862.1 hypothetical protein EDD73_1149 [Heliophilum fasciatum]
MKNRRHELMCLLMQVAAELRWERAEAKHKEQHRKP